MLESQQQNSYQNSIIEFYGNVISKKKILKN